MADRNDSLNEVRSFWDSHPCEGDWDTPDKVMSFRYQREPYLPKIIESNISPADSVLEIGCGQGSDLVLLARRAKKVTAIDLTPNAVERAGAMLSHFGLKGEIMQGNAENLAFDDSSFDAVYSYGVLHHTQNTQQAIDEALRVLKPGGKAVIMLYRSPSLQFLTVGMVRLITWPVRGKLAAALSTDRFRNSRFGTSVSEALGVPILKAYTGRQVRKMFAGCSEVKIYRYQTGFTRLRVLAPNRSAFLTLIDWFEERTRNTLGFFNVIIAKK